MGMNLVGATPGSIPLPPEPPHQDLHSPLPGRGGSLGFRGCGAGPAHEQESLSDLSFSFLSCSNRCMAVMCWRSCRPPAEGAARAEVSGPGGVSSSAVRSPKLPGPVPGMSTPLSLLGALPKGEGSLLQDDWAPGLA